MTEPLDNRPPKRPRTNLYLESRYRKLQRGLPQTIFWCPVCKGDKRRRRGCTHCEGFGKLTRESVQELIGRRLIPALKAKAGYFHGAGREDRDVLMLGHGRPFVFELTGVRQPDQDLEALRLEIVARSEGAIELQPFQRVRKERIAYWKQTHVDKIYRAEVTLGGEAAAAALAAAGAFAGVIVQRTPQRVAHRRADLDRERAVQVLELRQLAPDKLEVRVLCQHGTYVKEWISGDEARTTPSLASLLGVGCTCTLLDVEEVLTDDMPGPRLVPATAPAREQP
ncbi:MAG TPA: tRNA pseudouridine(54/55) synthase Pus10 [Planctomycetota bacterium]|nr:tRNA pseudouridine(54/55) synthase Pus10 [Planctomycetota bacterium]